MLNVKLRTNTLLFKKIKFQLLVLPISYLIFIIGFLSRDIRLQNIVIKGSPTPAEFNLSNIFCDRLPACSRVGTEVFGSSIQNVIEFVASVFHGNKVWHFFYLTEKEYYNFFYGFSSVTFRFICLVPSIIYLSKIFKNIYLKSISIICLTSIISAYPLYHINTSFGIYLVNYDYMVIFAMSLLLIFYRQIFASKLLLFIVVFFCTTIYENLGILIICAFIFSKKGSYQFFRKVQISAWAVFLSLSILLCGVLLRNNFKITNYSDGRYFQMNMEYLWRIIGAIFILLAWGCILGFLIGCSGFYKKSLNQTQVSFDLFEIKLYQGIIFGYLISLIFGFFVSGLVEFARQLLFLQIVFFYYGISLGLRLLVSSKS